MNPRAAVVVLLAVLVVVVLAVFFGAVRPSVPPPDAGRGSVESLLGWLRSRVAVTVEDLARGRPGCEDAATGTFVVAGGTTCRVALPDEGAFGLCAVETVDGLATAVVGGSRFPAGTLGPDDLGCAEPAQVDVYDEDMVLSLVCDPPGAVCRFGVEAPRD